MMQSKKTLAMLAPDIPLFLTFLNSLSFVDKPVWFANQRYVVTFPVSASKLDDLRMGINMVGTFVANQIKDAGFDIKKLKFQQHQLGITYCL